MTRVTASVPTPLPRATQTFSLPRRSTQERKLLKQELPELLWLERLLRKNSHKLQVEVESELNDKNFLYPLYSITLGQASSTPKPTLFITGGIHGVERIGTQVVLAWLESLLNRLDWDPCLAAKLAEIQLVLMPMVNPVGMRFQTRCNGQGIDLNRNAPIEAEDKTPFLAGGHRFSRHLPWYRGKSGAPMEQENLALEKLIQRQVFNQPFSLSVDLHSGFGLNDRLWFPFAFRKKAIGNIDQYMALKMLWEQTFPHHNYIFEPQSVHYISHGDLWDYFYIESKKRGMEHFLSLTLEMGSWAWVKKRPQQLLSFASLFHPQIAHRYSRVLRRHIVLLDFMLAAVHNYQQWLPNPQQQRVLKHSADLLWYKK